MAKNGEIKLNDTATQNVISELKTIESNLNDIAEQSFDVEQGLSQWQGRSGDAARGKSDEVASVIDTLATEIGHLAGGTEKASEELQRVDNDLAGNYVAGE